MIGSRRVQEDDSDENANQVPSSNTIENSSVMNKQSPQIDIPARILELMRQLTESLKNLTFEEKVRYVYRPLEYAFDPHTKFVEKYCHSEKKILLLGMNPGPQGMCQTGVPFGDVKMVRDWLQIEGDVSKPSLVCPTKTIAGFTYHRSEESGTRVYGYFRDICENPQVFFRHSFVYNYCPLSFMSTNGDNITPESLKVAARRELEKHCTATIIAILDLLKVEVILAFGKYVHKLTCTILKNYGQDIRSIYVLHPSSKTATTRTEWRRRLESILNENDLMQYFLDERRS